MPIKYNEYVKAPNKKIEWTPELVQELIKCEEDFIYFATTYIKVAHQEHGIIPMQSRDYQLDLWNKFLNHNRVIGLLSRQSGKTSAVIAYVLWFAIFNESKNIGIVSNKEASAKRFLMRLKDSYQWLPEWLKPGVSKWAETSVRFENGTLIQTAATSGDSFRGEPFACVTGDTKVCICDDDDNIFYTSIERLIGKNLTGSQILTEEGFQDFDGFVNQGKRNDLHRLTLSNNETLKCTPDHELRMSTGEYIQLQNLSIGDVLYNGIEVLNIESLNEEEYVYDALNVSNTNSYITNGVVSHNCLIMDEFAAVDPPWKAEQFWISVYPTVSASKTSKVIIISTAKGLHNQFHRIWIEAEKGLNAFTPVFYDWRVVPGRDDEWAEKEKKTIGAIPFSQEYDCVDGSTILTILDNGIIKKITIGELYDVLSKDEK
jgi:hypothetical protein